MPGRDTTTFRPGVIGLESRDVPTVIGLPQPAPNLAAIAENLASQVSPPTPPVPPIIAGPGQPLPIELARTRFTASFSGPFLIGPPRYTGQSAILSYRGLGTSNQFLHGNYQMIIVMPKDANGAITGAAFLEDKNLVGGNAVGLDINLDGSSLDSRGRPTQGAWVVDPNIYSGAFFFAQGTGTVRIVYARNGRASAIFSGHIYTNGVTNVLGNANLRP
jgi:hypothetical protein